MTRPQFLKRLRLAATAVEAEISANRGDSMFGRGISAEGYAGGYRDCLADVQAMLTHGHPSDSRRYWSKEPS